MDILPLTADTAMRRALVVETAKRLKPGVRIHFVGIGGISMCGLAELALAQGAICAGSDLSDGGRVAHLRSLGVNVTIGHDERVMAAFAPDIVVISRAIFSDNPERVYAHEHGLWLVERAVFLAALAERYTRIWNVAGTNGKSTTTALTALILMEAGHTPTVHLGAELIAFQTTVHIGQEDLFLSESCEFGRGVLYYRSSAALLLNAVHDHIDCYPTVKELETTFAAFLAAVDPGGVLCLPAGDDAIERIWRQAQALDQTRTSSYRLITYGPEGTSFCGQSPTFTYDHLTYDDGLPRFDVKHHGQPFGSFGLCVPGRFNVDNAMGAIALTSADHVGVDAIDRAFRAFRGAEGRFTYCGRYNGCRVYADYAHHPSAVKATVDAARHLPARHLHIAFQPLTHSRVRGFFQGFVDALKDVRPVFISEIYDDRERDDTISSCDLCDAINRAGGDAHYFATNEALRDAIVSKLNDGDVFLIMGVDLRAIADELTGRASHLTAVEP